MTTNNLKIVYCSYPTLNQQEPEWVQAILDPMFQEAGFCFYRPYLSLENQITNIDLLKSLSEATPNSILQENAELLRLQKECFLNIDQAQPMLQATDSGHPTNNSTSKDVFVLSRSNLVLSDQCLPSIETSMELFLASCARIPVICMTDKYLNSPWMFKHATVIMDAREKKQLLKTMIGLTG